MIKIPQNGKLSQPNNSDLFGNLWYTKNVCLDEEGYIKLSPRSVALVNSETNTDFNIPTSFGREQSGIWNIATTEKNFEVDISENGANGLSAAIDDGTSAPTNSFDSRGRWWQNRWHVTSPTGLFYKTTGNWTDASVSLTTGLVHALEVFRNRNEMCITNGNTVSQITTAYAASSVPTLTIPADFEATGLSYNNNLMAVITKLTDTASAAIGQNQESYFFVWDGSSSSASIGVGVGSDMTLAVIPYKSSWVILTRTGEIKYFNGGGFDVLGSLPFYFFNKTWGDSRNMEGFGDLLSVEGDIIYINVDNAIQPYGNKSEIVIQNAPSGIWCYDPKIGLYHRYSPSISPISRLTVTSGNVNTSTNIMTKTAGTIYATGTPVKYVYNAASLIGGLQVGRIYFMIKLSASTFSLAETKELAEAGVAIDLTSAAAAYFMGLNILDYGATRTARTGGIGIPEGDNQNINGLIFGQELYPKDASTDFEYLNFTCAGFENRGYFVTPKITSQGITDINQEVYIKHRPLKNSDKIILKYKDRDVIGIPVSTPQSALSCTWSGNSSLYTTANLSEVESYINDSQGECEVEIISGAGAGAMAQIRTITYSAGTYSIELEEKIDGVVGGYVCDIIIDNWKKKGETTANSPDNIRGLSKFTIGSNSTWIKYKVELRGSEVTVQELQAINKNNN